MAVLLRVCIVFLCCCVYVGRGSSCSCLTPWLAHQEGMFSSGIERKICAPWFCVGLCNVRVERNFVILRAKEKELNWPGILCLCLIDAVCAVGIVKLWIHEKNLNNADIGKLWTWKWNGIHRSDCPVIPSSLSCVLAIQKRNTEFQSLLFLLPLVQKL